MLSKPVPYGDPVDCADNILEPIPKSQSRKVLGANQQVKFQAKADAERICMTVLKSIYEFDSQNMDEVNSCPQVLRELVDIQDIRSYACGED